MYLQMKLISLMYFKDTIKLTRNYLTLSEVHGNISKKFDCKLKTRSFSFRSFFLTFSHNTYFSNICGRQDVVKDI